MRWCGRHPVAWLVQLRTAGKGCCRRLLPPAARKHSSHKAWQDGESAGKAKDAAGSKAQARTGQTGKRQMGDRPEPGGGGGVQQGAVRQCATRRCRWRALWTGPARVSGRERRASAEPHWPHHGEGPAARVGGHPGEQGWARAPACVPRERCREVPLNNVEQGTASGAAAPERAGPGLEMCRAEAGAKCGQASYARAPSRTVDWWLDNRGRPRRAARGAPASRR
jgi:hypothetical protein